MNFSNKLLAYLVQWITFSSKQMHCTPIYLKNLHTSLDHESERTNEREIESVLACFIYGYNCYMDGFYFYLFWKEWNAHSEMDYSCDTHEYEYEKKNNFIQWKVVTKWQIITTVEIKQVLE